MKPIDGYSGYYITPDGRVWSDKTSRWLRQYRTRDGYWTVLLYSKQPKRLTVHRLVAKAFLTPSSKPCVNHLDGDKSNNHASNLEWCTYTENLTHAIRTGLVKVNKVHMSAIGKIYGPIQGRRNRKVDDATMRSIKAEHIVGTDAEWLAHKYHVGRSTVYRILGGEVSYAR